MYPPSACTVFRQKPRLSDRPIPPSHHERTGSERGTNFTVDTFNFEQIANITQM
jgi:hypothetical protein